MAPSSSSKGSVLPVDILESILYRVPADSLNRFKSTCKRWFNLLKDKRFIYSHFDLVQENFIHFSNMVEIINPETNACIYLPFPDEFHDSYLQSIVMHCDGLLLCKNYFSSKLAVWNPFLNQVRWILKPNGSYSILDTYFFGYDSMSRDNYKILRIGIDRFTNMDNPLFEIYDVNNPTVEIYEFKSKSWRTLDALLDKVFDRLDRSVSVKGNTYWIVNSEHMSNKLIQYFDFSTETFKSMCPLPYDTDKEVFDISYLSAYREDKLSLLRQRIKPKHSWDIEVWITKNVKDRVVSWIKLFAVSIPDLPKLMPSGFPTFIQYFIDKNNKINVMSSEGKSFDSEGNLCVLLKIHIIGEDGFQTKEIGRHRFAGISRCVYLPSLVPVL